MTFVQIFAPIAIIALVGLASAGRAEEGEPARPAGAFVFTDATPDLDYVNQSGALNESFSDLMGVTVDAGDWLIAEDSTDPVHAAQARDLGYDAPQVWRLAASA